MSADNLEQIKLEENTIRDNLYKDEYSQHGMNTDPYYNLVEINEDVWNQRFRCGSNSVADEIELRSILSVIFDDWIS